MSAVRKRSTISASVDSPRRFSRSSGSTSRSYRWWRPRFLAPTPRTAARHRLRTAGGSPARREPGMRSSIARSSGFGQLAVVLEALCTGIVDQRFDHIDSGKLSPTGARAYLRRPSVTCTQLPQTPPMRPVADRRRPRRRAAARSERPCVRCARLDAEHVGERGVQIDVRGQRVDTCRGLGPAPGQRISSGMWPSGSNCGTTGLPQMSATASPGAPAAPSRRGSGRGRCTRSPRCRPTGRCASSSSSTRPNQWSIIESLAP